jgi:hypothetical protein
VAAFLDAIEDRIVAVLETARGADGALGTAAQNVSIPMGYFRRSQNAAPLTDAAYPREALDRAYTIDWEAFRDWPSPRNNQDTNSEEVLSLTLRVAFVAGPGAEAFVHARSNEDDAVVVLYPRKRAMMDARRIVNAVTCLELMTGDSIAPAINNVHLREDGVTLNADTDGRIIADIPIDLWIWDDKSAPRDP